jgi:hypothetical protein
MMNRPLPNKRLHEVVEFDLDGAHYTAGIGRDSGGRIAEIFLDSGKPGSAMRATSRDAAILVSMLLRHMPAELIAAALTRNDDNTAAGPIGRAIDEAMG